MHYQLMYLVSLRIQSEWGKMRTRITPNTDTFYAVLSLHQQFKLNKKSNQKIDETLRAEAYLEPSRISTMKLFCENI